MPAIKCVDLVFRLGSGGSWEGLWGPLLGIRARCFECMRRRFSLRTPHGAVSPGLGAGDKEFNSDAINLMLRFGNWFGVGWFVGGAVGTVVGYPG